MLAQISLLTRISLLMQVYMNDKGYTGQAVAVIITAADLM